MDTIRPLPLKINKRPLVVIDDRLKEKRDELDKFVEQAKYTNTLKFSKDVLFSHEIHANNYIEGYKDDVETIYEVIHKTTKIKDENKKKRIINLYKGYKYILEKKPINKDSLKELYKIVSNGLLSEEDQKEMGEYYRKNEVYIFYSSNPEKYDLGMPSEQLEEHMNMLLEYATTNNENLSKAEKFLKSQILHFYFVYVHPYYDINGRTSRTTSMWYLLNNKSYPFIIFNRAIQLHKSEYYRIIRESKKYMNATLFLEYMMEYTKEELEKDYIINMIKNNTPNKLTSLDFQTLHYILSMKSNLTYYDFIGFYNNQNDKKKPLEIKREILDSLLEKEIIIEGKKTKKGIGNLHNHHFYLNPTLYEKNPTLIKKLIIQGEKNR